LNTIKGQRLRAGLFISAAALVLVHLFQWTLPEATATWNHRVLDRLFQFRSYSDAWRPAYDATVVHVDINQSTLQKLERRQISRRHHARAITNLGAMMTAAQIYDVVFASPQDAQEDQQLVEAARRAGNVYFGLVFLFGSPPFQNRFTDENPAVQDYLEATTWPIRVMGEPTAIPLATDAIATFPELAKASRGLGSLNLQYDPDGVYRRYPLLFRYADAFYPSVALRAVCRYLGVDPAAVVLVPGRHLILPAARFPGKDTPRDIRVPIDGAGNMAINYVGPWERMDHYNFADILEASERPAEMALWQKELAGKIVIVSEILSGASDAGPVPTDTRYPLSGVHANALHTLLTASFLRPIAPLARLGCELLLAGIATAAFVYLPAMGFGGTLILTAAGFSGIAAGAFLADRWLADLVAPNILLFLMLVAMLVHRAIERTRLSVIAERERDLVEKELEIGRRIQADFFPSKIPTYAGWEIAAAIRPAKQVAGDFYDIFALRNERLLAVVIGDVCDKGVGAAIFMALFRSLIRAICQHHLIDGDRLTASGAESPPELLKNTIQQTNDYIAVTHESACMFATVFFAIIDVPTGEMHYVNCGHEPPFLITAGGEITRLKPTGPAVGTFPGVVFQCRSARIGSGDLLFACTDGVVETPDASGQPYAVSRLQDIIRAPHPSLNAMLTTIESALSRWHGPQEKQFDDITMLALKRSEMDGAS
jgi:sigma-B regulation protein RsbU (phosphoserine phosphatase)